MATARQDHHTQQAFQEPFGQENTSESLRKKMIKPGKVLARRAKTYWERRDLSALEKLRREPGAASNAEALYFVGLGLNALNRRREAIECWRQARHVAPTNEHAIRILAYELMDQA